MAWYTVLYLQYNYEMADYSTWIFFKNYEFCKIVNAT